MKIRVFCTFPQKFQCQPIQSPSSAFPLSQHAAARRATVRVFVKARRTTQDSLKELDVADGHNGVVFKKTKEEKWAIVGTMAAMAVVMVMGATADAARAWDGPEGPLVEEFWDNMRRYGLYLGAIYTILLPIVELLRTPVTAILIIVVLAGGFYLVSMVLSAMFSLSEFAYDYNGY